MHALLALWVTAAAAGPLDPPDAALQAFTLDLRQDGAADPGGETVADLLGAACSFGHALSCDAKGLPRGDGAALQPVAQASCTAGDPLGCVVAGWTLDDDPSARPLFSQACEAGYARACAELAGVEYRAGDKDAGRARAAAACEAGVGNACLVAGWGLDRADKMPLLERGCELGDVASCVQLANSMWEKDAEKPDHARAYALYTDACDRGGYEACNRLGQTWVWGDRGQKKSVVKGTEAYLRACELGYDWGCANGGQYLATGALGEREVERGERLLAAACDAGLGQPCWNLGSMELGRALESGSADAAWARMSAACGAGYNRACAWLGTAKLSGLVNGTPDRAGALETWSTGCFDHESSDACMALGRAESDTGGDGKPAWQKGCDLGSKTQCAEVAGHPGGARRAIFNGPGDLGATQRTRGVANHRALNRADELARTVYRAPTLWLQALAVGTLVGDGAASVDLAKAAPWMAALEAACAEHEPGACTVVGRARLEAGDADAAAAAFADGCGIGRLNRPVCDRLEDVLVEHEKAVSKETRATAAVTLCENRRPAFCKEAAKGFKKTDPDRMLGMVKHGCAAKDAWACDQVEKITGEPMKMGVGGLVGMTGVMTSAGPTPPLVGSDPILLGPLARDKDGVDATIQATMPALKACYTAALDRDAATKGRVDAKLIVQSAGTVERVTITHNTTGDPELGRCVLVALKKPSFPSTDGPNVSIVRYPFDFEPEEEQPE